MPVSNGQNRVSRLEKKNGINKIIAGIKTECRYFYREIYGKAISNKPDYGGSYYLPKEEG